MCAPLPIAAGSRSSMRSVTNTLVLVGAEGRDSPLDCFGLLRPRLRRGCAHDHRTGASARDETRDLSVARSRCAIAVDHARALARAKAEAVGARDPADVRRALVTQVFDPEAR